VNSDRGWYLVAVGVLALGISNSSISNSWIGNSLISDSARGLLDRAVAVADHLLAEAMRAFAVAQLMSDRGEPGWAHAQATIARAQPRLALVQAKIDANGLSRPDCIHGVRWALDDRSPPHCLRPKMEIGTSKTSNSNAYPGFCAAEPLPFCAKDPQIFLSQFAKRSYSGFARDSLTTTDLG